MKLLFAAVAATGLFLILIALLLGGGSDDPTAVGRLGTIPTATQPANPPEPIILGESRSDAQPAPGAGSAESTYVVRSGDTVSAIAIRLGIPVEDRAAWIADTLRLNGIADARLLAAGVELRLPPIPAGSLGPTATPSTGGGTPAQTPAAASSATPIPAPRPTVIGGGGTYTVVEGDNPSLIGQKLGVPASELAAWVVQLTALNNVEPTALFVGQVLELPAGTPSGAQTPTATAPPAASATPTPVP